MNSPNFLIVAQSLGITVSSDDAQRISDAIKTAYNTGWQDALNLRARVVAHSEREACAQIAKSISDKYAFGYYGNEVDVADEIAAAIRARSTENSARPAP